MVPNIFWFGFALFLLLVLAAGSRCSCPSTTSRALKEKNAIVDKLQKNSETLEDLYYTNFEMDDRLEVDSQGNYYLYLDKLLEDLNAEFVDIENRFKTKLQILNKSDEYNVTDIIQREQNNLKQYQNSRNVLINYYNSLSDNSSIYIVSSYNRERFISIVDCGVCDDRNLKIKRNYSSCLDKQIKELKNGLKDLERIVEYFSKNVKTVSQINHRDFVDAARKETIDYFNSLGLVISVEQVKDYFTPKLASIYNEINTKYETYHNLWRTKSFLTNGQRLIEIFQFVVDRVKEPNTNIDCDYIATVKEFLAMLNRFVSPYQILPIWANLDEFVQKYMSSIEGVTDIDVLINDIEGAFNVAKLDSPWSYTDPYEVDIENNEYATTLAIKINDLYRLVENGFCSGAVIIQSDAEAWKVFQCIADLLKRNIPKSWSFLAFYLRDGRGGDEIDVCFNLIPKV